jgi:hypothetical protein
MSVVADFVSASVACSCLSEVVYQRLDDRLTFQQLQQLQRQEDQQPAQQLLQLGMANTYNAVGYDYLLSVSHPSVCQPNSNSTLCHYQHAAGPALAVLVVLAVAVLELAWTDKLN